MSKHDQNIATRFNIFRKTYVAKSMVDAGVKLGCSHSKISDIETGKRAVDYLTTLILAKDFGLNVNWLYTGKGNLIIDGYENKPLNGGDNLETITKNIQSPASGSNHTLTKDETDMISRFSNGIDDESVSGNDMDHLIKMNKMMQDVLKLLVTNVKQLSEKVEALSDKVVTLESKSVDSNS
jgi:transcriptional regulator with XRE-family HTH domain